jgi:hypothetical protein
MEPDVVDGGCSKSRPTQPPKRLITKYKAIAKATAERGAELRRMTCPDMMKTTARAKAMCTDRNVILERNADVPHDSIIEDEEAVVQWMNRYSTTSLRWPMFDPTSLTTWVWGLPMVVPTAELGGRLNVD